MRAWQLGAQEHLIANATVAGDSLFVVSCEPETYEVRFDEMPALRAIPLKQRRTFEIAEDGSYIHWPARDVHLDLDGIRSTIDRQWKARSAAERSHRDGRYGAAIAALREARGLRQRDVAGLSERQVRRIEHGEGISTKALTALAAAHDVPLDEYLDEVAAKANEVGRRRRRS